MAKGLKASELLTQKVTVGHLTSLEQPRNEVMKKLEKDAEQKVAQLLSKTSTDQASITESLQNIMRDGSNEFLQKMGRNPTYSEMREMFG
jgi:DNA anti-recombination protein RmuC